MIFPTLPLYVDPSNSWTQPPQVHQQAAATTSDDQQPLPPAASSGTGPTRAVSMTERARLAKIPIPEAALSCPRCNSNNTKFCYFNNYSLTQPRHFCKTCRRYWTRGGTLRNVPVGGCSRRNRRSEKSSSLTSSTSPKLQRSKSSAAPQANLALLPAAPPLPMFAPAVPWSQLQADGYVGQGFGQWRLGYLGGMEAAVGAAGMNGYHGGEWSVGGSINGNGGGGWMSNSGTGQLLGFDNSSSMGNGST